MTSPPSAEPSTVEPTSRGHGPDGLVVDCHAHYFPQHLGDAPPYSSNSPWPSLIVDGDVGQVLRAGKPFRTVTAPLWDVGQRLEALDAAAVDLQLISPMPVLLVDSAPAGDAARLAVQVNDSIAAAVEMAAGRLAGLGMLPVQDVDLALKELERAIKELGLHGVLIGTECAGRELDDPDLFPLFEAAAQLQAAVFVHPLEGGGTAIRRRGQPYDFGLGMLTDTAMAATALVIGGVLEQLPDLHVGLSHGCGTFPWAVPRLRLAAELMARHDLAERFDELVGRLWVDSLVFDPEHLGLLVKRFGDHVMFGTDYPFIAGQLANGPRFFDAAVRLGALTRAQASTALHGSARQYLRMSSPQD